VQHPRSGEFWKESTQLSQSQGALTFGTPPLQGLPSVKNNVNILFFITCFNGYLVGIMKKHNERRFEK
jgi:hypothetical protein